MERANILFCSDGNSGPLLAGKLMDLKINVTSLGFSEFLSRDSVRHDIIIFFIEDVSSQDDLVEVLSDNRFESILKIVISDSSFREKFFENHNKTSWIQFYTLPLHENEFLFAIEKVIVIDQYKRVFEGITENSASRLEQVKLFLLSERDEKMKISGESGFLVNLLDFEKKIIMDQVALNESVREIATYRNMEYSALKDRVEAEEHLEKMRRDELLEARKIIEAQGKLIDHSVRELHEANRILDARESVEELSRSEAISLHDEIYRLRKENLELKEKIKQLTVLS